ncbi:hypothetical protein HPB51_001950 [Rhipicephalus microplus]|uniref:Cystatin domain-containing protein n=1 Tax=Rhipicephalus microplus TaxID=6941 RepID=A0A9J6DY96_RHIMP|nr:hypothetical protein HPB51_001950 [Rhipicephalus microplus]
MASSTLTLYGLGMVAFVVIACSAEERIPVLGGWQKHNAEDNAIDDELAHFAVSKQVANRQFFDTVLEIVDVESQTVAGTNYRIKFKITESTCPIPGVYSKATCVPKSKEVTMASSTVVLYGIAVAALAVVACNAEEEIVVPGGWQKHNVADNAIYDELAHFAVSKQVANREFFDTVLKIVDVESQPRKQISNNYCGHVLAFTRLVIAPYESSTAMPADHLP